MIAGNKVHTRKVTAEVLQCPEAIVKSDNINTSPVIVPISEK
jgi:hypothetical protein